MPVDIYYAPLEDALPVTFADAQQRFAAAGIPCSVEPEVEEMRWLVFPGYETTILASTKGDQFVFATVQATFDEDPAFMSRVEEVFQAMGFSAGEDF